MQDVEPLVGVRGRITTVVRGRKGRGPRPRAILAGVVSATESAAASRSRIASNRSGLRSYPIGPDTPSQLESSPRQNSEPSASFATYSRTSARAVALRRA